MITFIIVAICSFALILFLAYRAHKRECEMFNSQDVVSEQDIQQWRNKYSKTSSYKAYKEYKREYES